MARRIPGHVLLNRFLTKHGIANAAMARALGVSGVTALEWRRGTRTPSGRHQRALAVWTRGAVPLEAWPRIDDRELVVKPFDA